MGTPMAPGAGRPGNRTPVARAAKAACLVALVALAATGCSAEEVLRFGWPEGITPQADAMREFWTWSVVAALVIGVITWVLILWPVVAHRKRGDALPRQFQYNHFLEFFYTGIPVIIVVVLFYFTATTQNYVQARQDDPDVTVDVIGFQWNWEFDYRSYKNTKGALDVPAAPGDSTVRTIGNSAEIPILVLPSQRTIEYRLRGNDVIHSFFVPEFLFKRDVFPHPEKNNQDAVFQNSIDKTGSFVGRCAEFCGTYHAFMNFEVRVVTPEQFDQYMSLRTKLNRATGKGYTTAEALTEMNCGELCTPHAVTTSPFNTDRTARTASG